MIGGSKSGGGRAIVKEIGEVLIDTSSQVVLQDSTEDSSVRVVVDGIVHFKSKEGSAVFGKGV